MDSDFAAAMRRATGLLRASNVKEATRVIQSALLSRPGPPQQDHPESAAGPEQKHSGRPLLRLVQTEAANAGAATQPQSPPAPRDSTPSTASVSGLSPSGRMRKPLGEVLRSLRSGRLQIGAVGADIGSTRLLRTHRPPRVPDGAQFLSRSFTCAAGKRTYKLYVPASAHEKPLGLVVMLHGCNQDPDDFAAGTNMNAMAEAHAVAVAYPAQSSSSNAASCWNWFNPADQRRGAGEPSIIAGITQEIVSELNIDPRKVFVAGLSAGGAMAAVMAATYPDLYAAAGIHSGLPFRAANDVMSAFAAMRGESGLATPTDERAVPQHVPYQRTIVFHGTADQTVHPSNAESIVEGASSHHNGALLSRERGCSPEGRSYTRSVLTAQDGATLLECWLIDGGGHAWSGGRAEGSYTEPHRPDATAEMMRFFIGR